MHNEVRELKMQRAELGSKRNLPSSPRTGEKVVGLVGASAWVFTGLRRYGFVSLDPTPDVMKCQKFKYNK